MAKKRAKKKVATKKRAAKKQAAKKISAINMPMKGNMSKEEKVWQAESDVSTLMRAAEIKQDKARMQRAKEMAKKQAQEAAKVASKLG